MNLNVLINKFLTCMLHRQYLGMRFVQWICLPGGTRNGWRAGMGLNENILLSSALGASNLCKNVILLSNYQVSSLIFGYQWWDGGRLQLQVLYICQCIWLFACFDTSDALHLNSIQFVIFYMAIVSISLWVCIFLVISWILFSFCGDSD